MMAFRESYAMCVLLDGKVLSEKDGSVILPFGSEYKIRLRNKSRVRSVADVCIDGVTAVKGVVVDPDASVDLERFLDGSLSGGRRFELARLSDGRVEQPGDSQNGLVEVRFYQEKAQPKVETVIHHEYHEHHGHHTCHDPWCPCRQKPWDNRSPYQWSLGSCGNTTKGSQSCDINGPGGSSLGKISSGITRCSDSTAMWDVAEASLSVTGAPQAAATVRGGHSDQHFTSVSVDIDYSQHVALSLKLMGVSTVIDKCPCGRDRKSEKFCPDCGKKLVS